MDGRSRQFVADIHGVAVRFGVSSNSYVGVERSKLRSNEPWERGMEESGETRICPFCASYNDRVREVCWKCRRPMPVVTSADDPFEVAACRFGVRPEELAEALHSGEVIVADPPADRLRRRHCSAGRYIRAVL